MVNTPIPGSLRSEAKKAAKILREFSMPNAKTGPDKLIPAGILAKAKGLAIITVFKAGFLVTARGGSGIVIARLRDDDEHASGWSAPSAIGLAGLGGGLEVGLEVTDFVIILNSQSAVDAFSKGGNLTLGGNFTIAAGPLGRNLEGDIAVRSPAAIYTYSKTKGIFAGISVEGSALIERKDANRKFYGRDIRAYQILNGEVDVSEGCQDLYEVLKDHHNFAQRAIQKAAQEQLQKHSQKMRNTGAPGYSDVTFKKRTFEKDNVVMRSKSTAGSSLSQRRSKSEWSLSEETSTAKKSAGLERKESWSGADRTDGKNKATHSESVPAYDPWQEIDRINLGGASCHMPPSSYSSRKSANKTVWVVTEFPFLGELPCDLSFKAGERIKVTTQTSSQQDWWEGLDSAGHKGIFPANYVHVVS